MHRTIEVKLYLADAQERTLASWLRTCCWLYNLALEQRIKAYRRRGESVTYNAQTAWLTQLRKRKNSLAAVPLMLARGTALKRVDRAMQAFFRRVKARSGKAGFPRFKSAARFESMEHLERGRYVRSNNLLHIPKLGLVRFRGGGRAIPAEQHLLRIIRRASGWYAQVLVDIEAPTVKHDGPETGIDMGLKTFATLSDGSTIETPRFLRRSERRFRALQRRLSRRTKGSRRRRKAIVRVRRQHERVAAQRRNFCHQHSTAVVRKYSLIAVEDLNIKGLARTRMAKSIHDAGWTIFLDQLRYKAEGAGSEFVEVDARNTSRECPSCGAIKPKKLSERIHACTCGLVIDRDVAAARVILARASGVAEAKRSWRCPTSDCVALRHDQVGPVKREV